MHSLKRQNGMTAIGWMFVLLLIGFFALLALKMVPVYMEYFKVAQSLESLVKDQSWDEPSPQAIRAGLPLPQLRGVLDRLRDPARVGAAAVRSADVRLRRLCHRAGGDGHLLDLRRTEKNAGQGPQSPAPLGELRSARSEGARPLLPQDRRSAPRPGPARAGGDARGGGVDRGHAPPGADLVRRPR